MHCSFNKWDCVTLEIVTAEIVFSCVGMWTAIVLSWMKYSSFKEISHNIEASVNWKTVFSIWNCAFIRTQSLWLKKPCPVNSKRWFLKVAIPIFDSYGSVMLTNILFVPISQRKHAINQEAIVIASQLSLLCCQVLTQLPPKRRQKVVFDISDSSSKDRKVRGCWTFFPFCGTE